MASVGAQKLKVLHLMDILRTETDPDHGLTMPQIVERLAARGIGAERKGLYRDIETLREFGMDIRTLKRQPVQYALAERDFELPQLMLLVDAVQSSRFLSDGASNALVKSVCQLASSEERKALCRQARVRVHGRPKRQDRSDFVAVDLLQESIARKSKVSFRYYRYGVGKECVARRGGALHVVTPMDLVYWDGNYYLVAYSASDGEVRNYRVDRMGRIAAMSERADRNEAIASYDPEEAARTAFGLCGGERVLAVIRVDADLMDAVVDRLGRDVDVTPSDGGRAATVVAPVREGPALYGWLASLGDGAEVIRPKALRDGYAGWLGRILAAYRK